jgi:hypothetical protein
MILFDRLYPATFPSSRPVAFAPDFASPWRCEGVCDRLAWLLQACSISSGSRDSRASPVGEEIALLVTLLRQTCVPQCCTVDS